MTQVINTDSLSLLTQNSLSESQLPLSSAIERLSFGLRINSAKDDAASQTIANRFTANIKGLTQASRDANGGISTAQTTEGALNEISNNLQRVRELTVQTTNGTNSDSDLSLIQAETTQHLEEIDRVSEQAQFNGVEVLVEDNGMKIQAGANDRETIAISLAKIDAKALGLDDFNIDGAQRAAGNDLIPKFKATGANNYQISGTNNYTVNVNSGTVRNENGDVIFVSATDGPLTTKSSTKVGDTGVDATGLVEAAVSLARDVSIEYQDIILTNKGTGAFDGGGNGTLTASIGDKDVTPTIISSADAIRRDATLATFDPIYKSSVGQFITTKVENKAVIALDLDLNNAKKVGSSLVANGVDYEVSANDKTATRFGKTMHLSKSEGGSPAPVDEDVAKPLQSATNPLETTDKALAKVDNLCSDSDTVQNRSDSATTNLSNTVNNLSSTHSHIEDANYATETSSMSRAQVLQQAGIPVLAQTNQTTQNTLSLLR